MLPLNPLGISKVDPSVPAILQQHRHVNVVLLFLGSTFLTNTIALRHRVLCTLHTVYSVHRA